MNVTFIVNSLIKDCNLVCSEIAQVFSPDIKANIVTTERSGHAMRLALQTCEDSDAVISVGGDGTNNEVLNGLMLSKNPPIFGILPYGTGNDFAEMQGISRSPQLLKSALLRGDAAPIDVGEIGFEGEQKYFLNIADLGFGADAVKRHNSYRFLGRRFSYVATILATFLFYRKKKAVLRFNGRTEKYKLLSAIVANGSQFAAGYKIAPDADIRDGQFELVLYKKISLFDYMRFSGKIRRGEKLKHKQIDYLRTSEVRIETKKPVLIEADGEIVAKSPATIRLLHHAIKFVRC